MRNYTEAIKAIDPEGSVFVVNKTGPGTTGTPGDVVFSVTEDDQVVAVRIPNTWVPVDIALDVSAAIIKKSAVFRNLVAKGLVSIIPTKDALDVLADPVAQAELSRVSNRGKVTNQETSVPMNVSTATPIERTEVPGDTSASDTVAFEIVNRFKRGELEESKVVTALRGIEAMIADKELDLLLSTNTSEAINKELNAIKLRKAPKT